MDMPFNLENRFDSVEMSDVAQLRELQLDRMRWSLTHAYNNVPFYRKSFDEAGVHPTTCAAWTTCGTSRSR